MSDDTQSGFDTPKPGDDSLSPDSKPASDIDSRLEHMASRGFTPSQALGGSRPSGAWEPPTPEELQAQMPQYKVLEVIGRGGMGAVYKGWQSSLDRYVAIKILPPDLDGSDANFSARFKQEAKTMARLSHPGIVPVYDAGETNTGLFYFVMEFVEGSDVAQMVKQQGKLQPDHALAITAHVCDALTYAHEHGVIHRDIKPANIMLNHEGQVKVADFGLAKSTEVGANSGLTNTTMTVGTPDFIAPEALIMGVYSDHRADLYAVGVMLYNMLTGEIPRGRWKLPSEKVGSDVRFDAIINKAMEAEREDRYQSAREIRRELDVIQSTPMERTSPPMQQAAPASKPAASPSPPQRAAKVAKAGKKAGAPRKKSAAGMIMAIVGAVAAIGLGAFFLFQKPKSAADQGSDVSASLATATKDKPFVNSLGMKFVPVPITGGPTGGKKILFSIWETRRSDYQRFLDAAGPAQTLPKANWELDEFKETPDHPVVCVSWSDATKFCEWLTKREWESGKIGKDAVYRLPKDHEWSCAVGIGDEEDPDKSPSEKNGIIKGYLWGASWPPPHGAGNYYGEEALYGESTPIAGYRDNFPRTAPVGSFKPNELGLFDLGGNVCEWCEEEFGGRIRGPVIGTQRGESWWWKHNEKTDKYFGLSSKRTGQNRSVRYIFDGFRVVLDLSATTAAP